VICGQGQVGATTLACPVVLVSEMQAGSNEKSANNKGILVWLNNPLLLMEILICFVF
jgi:hypothetical protein